MTDSVVGAGAVDVPAGDALTEEERRDLGGRGLWMWDDQPAGVVLSPPKILTRHELRKRNTNDGSHF